MITKDDSEMYRCLNRFSQAVEKMHVDVEA